MSDLAVVIVSWNVRELLAACLRSLLADLERADLDSAVWVVDNASTDGTPEMVAADFPTVRLIASAENRGFAAGNNLALREVMADSKWRIRNGKLQIRNGKLQSAISNLPSVWLLNPDTEVLPGATAALRAALRDDPGVAVAGAKLLYGDGSLQQSAFRFPGLAQLAFELFPLPPRLYDTPLNGRYPRRLYDGSAPFAVDHPLGAAMMVRAEAIAQVGLLDEGYRMYCEEIDWCWRMRRAGWRAVCAPAARVVHHAGRSTAQVPIPSFVNLWSSRARLYARHHARWRFRLARALLRAGLRRRLRDASPEWAAAYREVLAVWDGAATLASRGL